MQTFSFVYVILQEAQLPIIGVIEFQRVGGRSHGIVRDVQDTSNCAPVGGHT